MAIAGALLLNRTGYRRYVEPFIHDIRCEHYQALQQGERRLAKWIVVRGYLYLCIPLIAGIWRSFSGLRRRPAGTDAH